jgi:hypothetical protein
VRVATGRPAQRLGDAGAHLVMSKGVSPDDGSGCRSQPAEVVRIAVRLAQANQARPGLYFDDGPQGIGLVNADLVEQRRVGESYRGDGNAGNFEAFMAYLTEIHAGIVRVHPAVPSKPVPSKPVPSKPVPSKPVPPKAVPPKAVLSKVARARVGRRGRGRSLAGHGRACRAPNPAPAVSEQP